MLQKKHFFIFYFVALSVATTDSNWGFYPFNIFRKIWEYIIYFLSLFSLWECLYVWFVGIEFSLSVLILNTIIDLFYIADIIISLRTGILQNGMVQLDKDILLKSIPKWRKIIFYISPLPFYLIGTLFDNKILFKILICTKILRVLRLYDSTVTIRKTLYYVNYYSKIILLFSALFTVIHFFACIFWLIGRMDESWLYKNNIQVKTKFQQYIYSYYFITTTVLTVGYGDIHVYSFTEICLIIVVELVGFIFYNYTISSIVSLVADNSRDFFINRYQRILDGFKEKGISKDSMNEILRYFEYIWEKASIQTGYYETSKQFPESLRKKLSLTIYIDLFKKIEVFNEISQKSLAELALLLKPRIFTPGDLIVKPGKVGNHIFILEEGTAGVYNKKGTFLISLDETKGTIIGANSMITGEEETVKIIAHTYVQALELSREDFNSITEIKQKLQPEKYVLANLANDL